MLLTLANYGRRALQTSPDKWWRVQHFLRLSANYRGRKRNCYKIAYRYVHKALLYATEGRKLKKIQFQQLVMIRLEAAAQEHNMNARNFLEGLAMSNIQLDKKVLSELAIYEPRTFKSLAAISEQSLKKQGLGSLPDIVHDKYPTRIYTRGML